VRGSLLAICVAGISVPAAAQTHAVTLSWEPNPDEATVGYIVYVGNESGSYTEKHDVGDQTSFRYLDIVSGRPYFFAVAAYGEATELGPRSQEVFFLDGVMQHATAAVASAPAPEPRSIPAATSSNTEHQQVCFGGSDACYQVDRLASLNGDPSSLAPIGDGRLFFIEDRRRVRALIGDTLSPEPAMTAESEATQLAGLVVDPAFSRTRLVYVGQVDTHSDGSRELSIVRYREVQNRLGEGAVIVSGLPLPLAGDAPFAIDSAGRIYVAMPAMPGEIGISRTPYGGMLLRFERDGTVPHDNRAGSPVFARGYAQPISLQWSAAGSELWMSGEDAGSLGSLARLPLDGAASDWPRIPTATRTASVLASPFGALNLSAPSLGADGGATHLFAGGAGSLIRVDVALDGSATTTQASAVGQPMSVAVSGSQIYVALRADAQSSASEIVRLRPN
jgi:hypothetical protein